jgi:malonyl-CoA O-methyltransferase
MNSASLDTIRRDFSRAAAGYDDYAQLQRHVLRQAASILIPYVPNGGIVLDAGCGTAMLAEVMPGNGKAVRLVGVDAAEGMCAVARQRMPCIACADVTRLPFRNGVFDGIVCSLVLQWAERLEVNLAELARVTRRGGHCALTLFAGETLCELRVALDKAGMGERVHSFRSRPQMEEAARVGGWNVKYIRTQCISEPYTGIWNGQWPLSRYLKEIGAASKRDDRPRGILPQGAMESADDAYHTLFGNRYAIPATWEVVTLLLER